MWSSQLSSKYYKSFWGENNNITIILCYLHLFRNTQNVIWECVLFILSVSSLAVTPLHPSTFLGRVWLTKWQQEETHFTWPGSSCGHGRISSPKEWTQMCFSAWTLLMQTPHQYETRWNRRPRKPPGDNLTDFPPGNQVLGKKFLQLEKKKKWSLVFLTKYPVRTGRGKINVISKLSYNNSVLIWASTSQSVSSNAYYKSH